MADDDDTDDKQFRAEIEKLREQRPPINLAVSIRKMQAAMRIHRHAKLDWLTKTSGHAEGVEHFHERSQMLSQYVEDNRDLLRSGVDSEELRSVKADITEREAILADIQRCISRVTINRPLPPDSSETITFLGSDSSPTHLAAGIVDNPDEIPTAEAATASNPEIHLGADPEKEIPTGEALPFDYQKPTTPGIPAQPVYTGAPRTRFDGDDIYRQWLEKPSELEQTYSEHEMRRACELLLNNDIWVDDGQHGIKMNIRLNANEEENDTVPPVFHAISQIISAFHFAELGGEMLTGAQLEYTPQADMELPLKSHHSDHYLSRDVRSPLDSTYEVSTADSMAKLHITLVGEPELPSRETLKDIQAAIRNTWPDIAKNPIPRLG